MKYLVALCFLLLAGCSSTGTIRSINHSALQVSDSLREMFGGQFKSVSTDGRAFVTKEFSIAKNKFQIPPAKKQRRYFVEFTIENVRRPYNLHILAYEVTVDEDAYTEKATQLIKRAIEERLAKSLDSLDTIKKFRVF